MFTFTFLIAYYVKSRTMVGILAHKKIDFADDLNWPSGCQRKKFKCKKFTDDDNNDGTQLNHVNSSHDYMNQVS